MAAAVRHTVKLGTHKTALEEAGDQGLPFTKGPLVFETTCRLGEETQKWWKSIVEMEADQRIPGAPQSRREQGLEHTWSSNKFSSYWLQKNSMPHARIQADSSSSVDRHLPEGLRANTASYCLAPLELI